MTTMTYTDQAEQIRTAHERAVAKIRDRYDRKEITADLRDTLIARSLRNTKQQLTQLREADKAERTNRKRTLEAKMFAPDAKDSADPAVRSTAYRQARAHASTLGDTGALRAELREAVRAGDTLMQKAIFQHAHDTAMQLEDKGLAEVVIGYINEVRPDLADDYRELVDLTRQDKSLTVGFHREAAYLVQTPRELGRYHDHQVERLADDPRFADAK